MIATLSGPVCIVSFSEDLAVWHTDQFMLQTALAQFVLHRFILRSGYYKLAFSAIFTFIHNYLIHILSSCSLGSTSMKRKYLNIFSCQILLKEKP